VILVVTLNPALDVTHDVPGVDWAGVNRPAVTRARAGGKGLNVARVAIALGADVTAVGLLAGHAGRWMAETLAEEGIPGRWAWADGETRTCLAIHDAAADDLTELNEAGPIVSEAAWTRRDTPDHADEHPSHAQFRIGRFSGLPPL